MKICSKCNLEKELINFNKSTSNKDGLAYECRDCKKERDKKYRESNKEKRKIDSKKWENSINGKNYRKKYKIENKELLKDRETKRRIKNRERIREYHKKWVSRNREKVNRKIREWKKKKFEKDPISKISNHIRKTVLAIFKDKKFNKNSNTESILGCSFKEFKLYLESKFETWMTWENHGVYTGNYDETWQLDHIIPISSAKSEEDIYKLNHYTNFQPLCSRKNHEKKDYLFLK